MIETIAGVSIIAVVIGITELIKKGNYLNERFIPLVPFVVAGLLLALVNIGFTTYIMGTLVYGLMANGLYSSGKKLKNG